MKTRQRTFITKIAVSLAALMLGTLILPACKNAKSSNYTISVNSMGSVPLTDVSVELYSGGQKVASRKTNSSGKAAFNVSKGKYDVQLTDLPAGYYTEGYTYSLTESQSNVTFNVPSKVIEGVTAPANTRYVTGSVMYDFSVTTPAVSSGSTAVEGKTITLSELLNTGEKKAVLLNFWGSLCGNCADEFPVIEEVYKMYEDKIAVLALDNKDFYGDTVANVVEWQTRYNLTFDMAMDTADVAKLFGVTNLPTSIMIDRYGVVCDITVGAVTDKLEWTQLFGKFTADNYTPSITNPGASVDDKEEFIPDVPADFNKTMSPSADINKLISPTLDAIYTSQTSESTWPWEILGDSIVPTNRKDGDVTHRYTMAAITATFNVEANKVITFDYKCRSDEGDTLQVVVSKDGIGKLVFIDSGEMDDFEEHHAYVTLEAGRYSIAFVYFKDYYADEGDDCVYVKNLRLEDVSAVTEPLDVAYYVARGYNAMSGAYDIHDEVYLADDGYYRVKNRANSDGTDPYLLADIHNGTPYFQQSSIYQLYISINNCVFGGVNYYNQLLAYNSIATNSAISGLIPVDEQLKTILDAIAKSELGTNYETYSWTDFCSFYIHYGSGKPIDNPVNGIYYKSAFKAEVGNNVVDYERFLTPRGMIFEFTVPESGAYAFQSTYTEEEAKENAEAIAWLYTKDSIVAAGHHEKANILAYSGEDQYIREGGEYNFHIYEYLEKGDVYYIVIAPGSMDTIEVEIPFEIKYLGDSYETLEVAAAGFYTTTTDGSQYILPTYCTPVLGDDGLYYTTKGEEIYVDLIYLSRLFDNFSVEQLLNYYFYNEVRVVTDTDNKPVTDDDGNVVTTKFFVSSEEPLEENSAAPAVGKPTRTRAYPFKLNNVDYTDIVKSYYDKRDTDKTSLTYGMVQIDEQLRQIISLFYSLNSGGALTSNEWMKACYFKRVISAPNA